VGVPVELISIGPNRDETIARSDPFGRLIYIAGVMYLE
jgi:hypothetical protein